MRKRFYAAAILFAAFFAITGNECYAAESVSKEIIFEIAKDYEACSFTITTQMEGNFVVELAMENGDEAHTSEMEDSNVCVINVEDVKAGRWKVKVTEILSDNPDGEESTADTEDQGDSEAFEEMEPKAERTPDEVIGKIQVQAKAIDKTAFSIGNVDVARDIVGLQSYFKDDAIVVEWTDTSCGNVNVSIIDTYTNQILDKETISGRYYEFELPELVTEITIDVVPATSSNIAGANSRYTLPVENNPDAVVTYEDKLYTNKDTVPVTVKLNKAYSLLFLVNGAEVKETGILTAGEHSYEVPITEGSNEVLTYVVDADHNMRSTSYTVIRDSIKPALTLDYEYDGITTYDDTITITGTIRDYETFLINETEPVVAGDGSFKSEYILKDGENILNIRATDIAGNETLYSATVTKMIPETPAIMDYIGPICVILFLVVGIGVKIFISKGKNHKDEKPLKEKKEKAGKERKESAGKLFTKKEEVAGKKLIVMFGFLSLCVIGFYLFFTNILICGNIPSASMAPTLQIGDYVISNGLAYVKHEPQRGDIVVFKHDGIADGEMLIKRVVGVPGDSLVFVDGYLYINGNLVYEPYLSENVETNCFKDYDAIPEGCYFVMGDNRENSVDSRFWENPYVRKDEIKGKLMSVIPVSRMVDTVVSFF